MEKQIPFCSFLRKDGKEVITSFAEFCEELIACGFTLGGVNAKGIFTILSPENTTIPADSPIKWYTGDPETDPCEWKYRVMEECSDIAYGKVFFGTSGYITREWYPLFLKVRRQDMSMEDWYDRGKVSQLEKGIYDTIAENKRISQYALKCRFGVTPENTDRFDRAMTNLQKRLFITMCGQEMVKNDAGIEYGWGSTLFCTVEEFWRGDLSQEISFREAYQRIHDRILKINPDADEKTIRKFIL